MYIPWLGESVVSAGSLDSNDSGSGGDHVIYGDGYWTNLASSGLSPGSEKMLASF